VKHGADFSTSRDPVGSNDHFATWAGDDAKEAAQHEAREAERFVAFDERLNERAIPRMPSISGRNA